MSWCASAIKEIGVYRSMSNDVFTNLAFEDWILKNVNLSSTRILFFWRNTSCVVIGRHQNPWNEVNFQLLKKRGVKLARRRSGGGAVYHDLGNLNCTVFSSRQDYDRGRNLQLVCDALNERWKLYLKYNLKDDIIFNDTLKVSGSSAMLLKDMAYHHFTLLLDVNRQNLDQILHLPSKICIPESRATPSIPSNVVNLCDIGLDISCVDVCELVAEKFYAVHRVNSKTGIISIDPLTLPGISDIRKKLQEWNWIYGKSPKFKFQCRKCFSFGDVLLNIEIHQGVIQTVKLDSSSKFDGLSSVCKTLEGVRFWKNDIRATFQNLLVTEDKKLLLLCEWILDIFE